jgi:hypothetical protein
MRGDFSGLPREALLLRNPVVEPYARGSHGKEGDDGDEGEAKFAHG